VVTGSIAGSLAGRAEADVIPDSDLAYARLLVAAELLAADFYGRAIAAKQVPDNTVLRQVNIFHVACADTDLPAAEQRRWAAFAAQRRIDDAPRHCRDEFARCQSLRERRVLA